MATRASICGSRRVRAPDHLTLIPALYISFEENSVQYSLSRTFLAAPNPDCLAGKEPETHSHTEKRRHVPGEPPHLQLTPLLSTPHTLPLNIHPPHLPPPLLPQRPPHLLQLLPPQPQQPPLLNLHPLLEHELPIYRPQLIMVAKEAELNIVVSDMAHDVVFSRADFMQDVGRARGDVADGRGNGVGAADADGLVHVAHGGLMCVWDGCEDVAEGKGREDNVLEQVFPGSVVKAKRGRYVSLRFFVVVGIT